MHLSGWTNLASFLFAKIYFLNIPACAYPLSLCNISSRGSEQEDEVPLGAGGMMYWSPPEPSSLHCSSPWQSPVLDAAGPGGTPMG